MKIQFRSVRALAWAFFISPVLFAQQTAPYFDDSPPDRILLGNAYYELALSKQNGGVLGLLDKSTGAALTAGSRMGCLWGTNVKSAGPNAPFTGGCAYTAGTPNGFAYSWDSTQSQVKLTYSHDPNVFQQIDATVVISASSDRFFDLQLQINNRAGGALAQVLLPFDLLFSAPGVQAGYLPFLLPGVRLQPKFFITGRSQTAIYPGATAFADYEQLSVEGGQLALYTINPSGPIQPVILGFDSTETSSGSFRLIHAFQTWIPNGSAYTSPVVRVRVGQSAQDAILALRNDNGIAGYPSIQQKLGNRFDALIRAPVVKADVRFFIAKPFLDAIPDLDQFSSPAVLHAVDFQPGGLDRSSPDYLPPDSRWGGTADFASWVRAAQARNLLIMPYINPTWWDPQSPTVLGLGSQVPRITTLDVAGKPVSETYGPDTGYVVCPFAPFVETRLGSLMAQWQSDVPADYLFLDQIGSRGWLRDHNPASPTQVSYSDGWLAFWNQYSNQGLMTEDGWDRLAAQGVGFMGSPLTGAASFNIALERYGVNGTANVLLGSGNWDPYPLATWLMHDKVLFYEKDLPEVTTTDNTEVVTLDLEFGYLLKYLWPGNPADPPAPGRVQLAHVLHRTVVPLYAGNPLTGFSYLAPEVPVSRYGKLSVIANWQQTRPYSIQGNSIIPGGYLATTSDGAVLAGALTGNLNGSPLSPGAHYVVIERQAGVVSVWQPVGDDTPLAIDPPLDWTSGQTLQITALDQDSNRLAIVDFSFSGQRVRFQYSASVAGSSVDHYEIENMESARPFVANAASFLDSAVTPGELVTLFGPGIGPLTSVGLVVGPNGVVETQLGGTQVLFDGVAAPVIYTSKNQISVAVPYSVAGKAITNVQILFQSSLLGQITIPVAASAPGIFTVDQTGAHGGAILNQDTTPNSVSNPAQRGSIVSIYATGAGQTAPAGMDGLLASGTLPQPLIPVRVQIGGEEAEILYAGAAPQEIAGVLQVNARIPSGFTPNSQAPVVLIIGHYRSAAGVTVAVE